MGEVMLILTTTPNAVPRPFTTGCLWFFAMTPRHVGRPRNAERRGDLRTADTLRCQQNEVYRVSSRVNHVANDDEECSRPVVIADTQDCLFAYGRNALLRLESVGVGGR